MGWRTVKPNPEDRLESYNEAFRRQPLTLEKIPSGACIGCGNETTRRVTVGPPGDTGNGWQCKPCGEKALRAQFCDVDDPREPPHPVSQS